MEETPSGIPLNRLLAFADRSSKKQFAAGAVLIRQGDISDCIHVIISGRVRVERSHPNETDPLLLAELGPGEVVGEIGIATGAPRSATVIAIEDTETVELRAEAWRRRRPLPVSHRTAAPLQELVAHRLHMTRLVSDAARGQQAVNESEVGDSA